MTNENSKGTGKFAAQNYSKNQGHGLGFVDMDLYCFKWNGGSFTK
ncbi:MAG: hypothetical protein VCF25_02135 [Candidatus Poribacteria bacterium]